MVHCCALEKTGVAVSSDLFLDFASVPDFAPASAIRLVTTRSKREVVTMSPIFPKLYHAPHHPWI
jgi:hypothetical protein